MAEPKNIKLADPCLSEAEESAAVEVIRSGRVVAGPRVAELEARLERLTGRAHAVALSSGTAALLALMHALGIGPRSKVVVPALAVEVAAGASAAGCSSTSAACGIFSNVAMRSTMSPCSSGARRSRIIAA